MFRETRERRDLMPEVSRIIYPYLSAITSWMDDFVAKSRYVETNSISYLILTFIFNYFHNHNPFLFIPVLFRVKLLCS